MISISRLLCDTVGPGDGLRYRGDSATSPELTSPVDDTPRPIVVWNCTRRCNLKCIHCYARAIDQQSPDELGTDSAKAIIRDLAEFGVPVILFSGGEPLLRQDLLQLASFASEQGMRLALSTNGTLITKEIAEKIRDIGFAEVGISLDGVGKNNDSFRGRDGAYRAALDGIRNCVSLGLRVSLRLTITRFNYCEIPAIFSLVEQEKIDRICFYHLAYSGRAAILMEQDLNLSQTRKVVETICQKTLDLHNRGLSKEVLTVGNHADGVYLYLKTKMQNSERADRIYKLLKMNGGNNSGIRIGAIDDVGNVHPDQFWWHYSLGNVRQRKFGDIWTDTSEPLLRSLRDRRRLLQGRCARCSYLDLCNGNLRVRAEAVYGNIWAQDPACYLSNEEIGLA